MNIAGAMGAASQGYWQGVDAQQAYRGKEQDMLYKAEQIKLAKTQNQMASSQLNVQKDMEYIHKEATNNYKKGKTQMLMRNMYEDYSKGVTPNFNDFNANLAELPELQQALGTTKIHLYNPNAPTDLKAARSLVNPQNLLINDEQDRQLNELVGTLGKSGFIGFTDDGKAVDMQTIAAITGSLQGMPASLVQDVEKKALGIFNPTTATPVKDTEHQEFEKSTMYQQAVAKNNGKPLAGQSYETAFRNWKGTTAAPKGGSGKPDNRAANAYSYMNSIGFFDEGYKFKQEHMDKAVELGFMSDEQRKTYKAEINDANKISTAYSKGMELKTLLDNPKLDIGWTENLVSTAKKVLTSEWFAKLPQDQQVAQILKITADTKGGAILADYMRAVSGTGVAQAEADRLINIFKAGNFANKQAYQTAVTEFANGMKGTVTAEANRLGYDVPIASMTLKKGIAEADAKYTESKPSAKPEQVKRVIIAGEEQPTLEEVNLDRKSKGLREISETQYIHLLNNKKQQAGG